MTTRRKPLTERDRLTLYAELGVLLASVGAMKWRLEGMLKRLRPSLPLKSYVALRRE